MRSYKKVISFLTVCTLMSVVRLEAFPISWTFSGDTISIDLNNGADVCTGVFTNGQMSGVQSTGGTYACAGKMVGQTQFSLTVINLNSDEVNGETPSFLGATDVQIYGQAGSDTTNFMDPNPFGAAFAAAFVAAFSTQTAQTLPEIFNQLPPDEVANSQVMTVRIHNHVARDWSASLIAEGMTTFNLSGDLDEGESRDLTIEFDASASTSIATATFTNHNLDFVVMATKNNNAVDVMVNWGIIHTRKDHFLIPPSLGNKQDQSIGFRAGGVYNIGIFTPSTLTTKKQGTLGVDWRRNWMKHYSTFIEHKTIFNIIIPGTHDAGSTRFSNLLLDFFLRTQSENFGIFAQLNAGVRSFDLRIQEFNSQFFIMHNSQTVMIGGTTPLLLTDVLDDVLAFVTTQGNEDEIIILDFHRFVSASLFFNFAALESLILSHPLNTQGRLIHHLKASLTYSQLINDSSTARVIVAWNNALSLTSPFWPGVDQKWAGPQVFLTTDMYAFFTSQFTAPQTALTSAQDALNRPDGGPFFFFHDSSAFFSDISIASNLNIIHSDFVDKSIMVETAIALNMVVQ